MGNAMIALDSHYKIAKLKRIIYFYFFRIFMFCVRVEYENDEYLLNISRNHVINMKL